MTDHDQAAWTAAAHANRGNATYPPRTPTARHAARLEANPTTIANIRKAADPLPMPPFGPTPAGDLFGIPIVVNDSLPVDGWRLVDDEGQVIHESHAKAPATPRRRWWHRLTRRSAP